MKDKRKLTRVGFVADESLNYFITIFVTTNFLGYITESLGISDAQQGIISTITTLSLTAQLLAPLLLGRRVKRIVISGMLLAHLAFLGVYILPIFSGFGIDNGIIALLLIIFLAVGNFVNNALTPSRIVWLMQSVDNGKRGSFTAFKEMISLAGGVIVSLLLGVMADAFRDADGSPQSEYYVICAVAIGIMLALNVASLMISSEEASAELSDRPRFEPRRLLADSGVRRILAVDVLWHVALGVSTPFFASYLREDLAFNFTTITLLSIVTLVCRFAVSPIMGKIGDKRGFGVTMLICIGLNSVAFVGAALTAPGGARWMYVVYAAFSGFALAGVNSGLMNLVYDYVSPESRSSALGIKSAVGGIAGFLTTVAAGYLLELVQGHGGVTLFGASLTAQQILSLLSFAVMIILAVYLKTVVFKMKRVDE